MDWIGCTNIWDGIVLKQEKSSLVQHSDVESVITFNNRVCTKFLREIVPFFGILESITTLMFS